MRPDAQKLADIRKAYASVAPLGLVGRAIEDKRQQLRMAELASQKGARPDFAAEAAMKCADPAFKAFLEAEHGLERPLTDDRCAQRVRTICGVTSRRELNDNGKAGAAWNALRKSFDVWRKRERG